MIWAGLLLAVLFGSCAWAYVRIRETSDTSETGRWIKLTPMTVLAALLGFAIFQTGLTSDVPWQFWLLLLAVVASLIGDHRLASDGDIPLRQGMVAFAVAHLAYVVILFDEGHAPPLVAFGVFAVLIGSTFWWLLPYAQALRGPVLGYIAVISAMGLGAWAIVPVIHGPAQILIPMGAGLFILSDMILAAQLFRWQSARKSIAMAILLPYFWGQLALVLGLFLHSN